MRVTWYVYVLECSDGTLYTGSTTDLGARLERHGSGRGAKYTRSRGVARLHYWEAAASRSAAQSREAAIKALPRAAKLALKRDPGIRPARVQDEEFIRRTLQELSLDGERVEARQFFIAEEGGHPAGFARIKPYRGCFELAGVAVLTRFRERGVGSRLVRALVERFPTKTVWITTNLPEYFARFGFEPASPPVELRRKLEGLCHEIRTNVRAMRAPRPRLA